jgi:hypothetical protein
MKLQQDSIIVSDRLQALFDFELRNYFTHVFVTDGECAMKYSGEEVRMENWVNVGKHSHIAKSSRPMPHLFMKISLKLYLWLKDAKMYSPKRILP